MSVATTVEKPSTKRRHQGRDSARVAWPFVGPVVVIVALVLAYPLGYSLWLTFVATDPYTGESEFIGLDNYQSVISDPLFGPALVNTLHFAAITIVGSTLIGLLIALVLNQPSRLQGIARAALIVPWSLSHVIVAIIWGWIYNGTYGALNGVLSELGIIDSYQSWFSDGRLALTLIAFAFVWNLSPYATLLFLAGLQAIPPELTQAAKVDGANAWQIFRYVKLPWLRPSLLIVLVITSLEGFLAFTMIYVLTSGGPGNATVVLSWWGYATTFNYNDIGKGAAILYLLGLILMALSLAYIRYVYRGPETVSTAKRRGRNVARA